MRFVYVTQYYPEFIQKYESESTKDEIRSYSEQLCCLMDKAFGWYNIWSKYLTPYGYEVREIVANAITLQSTWAKERGLSINLATDSEAWRLVVLEQLKFLRPDVLFYDLWDVRLIEAIRACINSLRLTIGWIGSSRPKDERLYKSLDLVLSCAPESISYLLSVGVRCRLLSHGFDPDLLKKVGFVEPIPKVTFIGQIVPDDEYHFYRMRLLQMMRKQVHLVIYSPQFYTIKSARGLKFSAERVIGEVYKVAGSLLPSSTIRRLPLWKRCDRAFRSSYTKQIGAINPPLFGLSMYRMLASAAIGLNVHAGSSSTHVSNMRLFETTGMGAAMLVEAKKNLREFFIPDEEVITYSSPEECVSKAKWFLANPGECRRIGLAGQRRTLKDHTWDHRAVLLDEIIRDTLDG